MSLIGSLVCFAVPGAPSLPTGEGPVVFELLNSIAVQLYWDPPVNPNGVILDYQIIYYEILVSIRCLKCTQCSCMPAAVTVCTCRFSWFRVEQCYTTLTLFVDTTGTYNCTNHIMCIKYLCAMSHIITMQCKWCLYTCPPLVLALWSYMSGGWADILVESLTKPVYVLLMELFSTGNDVIVDY